MYISIGSFPTTFILVFYEGEGNDEQCIKVDKVQNKDSTT